MLIIVILLLFTLLLGYVWGKHDGQIAGYEKGVVNLPLLLREQSFTQGYCILCNEQLEKKPSDD